MIKTQTMITQLVEFLYESNLVENEPDGIALLDSVKAWEYLSVANKLNLSNLLSVHNLLMKNLNHRIAGRIRTVDVHIGKRKGENPLKINDRLDALLKKEPETWDEIKDWHVEFEDIHPFEDGNGRTGRIIMNWQRLKIGLPIMVIHHGEEQFEYYSWFQN